MQVCVLARLGVLCVCACEYVNLPNVGVCVYMHACKCVYLPNLGVCACVCVYLPNLDYSY